jgi:hypothetical protein
LQLQQGAKLILPKYLRTVVKETQLEMTIRQPHQAPSHTSLVLEISTIAWQRRALGEVFRANPILLQRLVVKVAFFFQS